MLMTLVSWKKPIREITLSHTKFFLSESSFYFVDRFNRNVICGDERLNIPSLTDSSAFWFHAGGGLTPKFGQVCRAAVEGIPVAGAANSRN
jgi:hypothetical protein